MKKLFTTIAAVLLGFVAMAQLDPARAPKTMVDRFSASAGALFVRDGNNGLPGPNEAINFDEIPFITKGFSADGRFVEYYNFDVQPETPAPIYVLFREGEMAPVSGQLNIIDTKPGDMGYNDFWVVNFVTVPADYVANTVTSAAGIMAGGCPVEMTEIIVNCPVVPEGSTASKRFGGGNPDLITGWYKDSLVYYFEFSEKSLAAVNGNVPLSPIYVTFNINPDQPGGGPASGFKTEEGSEQTHNVVGTIPTDESYSPLWAVNIFDNADFDEVSNLATAEMANILAFGAANVNCPVVVAGQFDPARAPKTMVDRFSSSAGALFVRDGNNGLPGPNEAINFDEIPFITKGFSADGRFVEYYNFDVQPETPAPIYVLFREGEMAPVSGQLNIIDTKPGDMGYNDFWVVNFVTVPADYVANTVTSAAGIMAGGYPVEMTEIIVNCPVVPEGSTASKRFGGGNPDLITGWYKDSLVYYFEFSEKSLAAVNGNVPLSPIYVTFNINPDQPGGGPASGFKTEEGSEQTHNVVGTIPTDESYSPLWAVNIFDNADFDEVSNLATAEMANILAFGAANVNCPVVTVDTCIVNGGELSLMGGGTALEICAGDGVSDAFNVMLTGNTGSNSAWVITDDQGNILGLPQAPPFDLEGEGPGVCLVWHLSFEDGLMGAEVGKNASDLSGCFDLSNPIEVTRNGVNGGELSLMGGGTALEICAGDGVSDAFNVMLTGNTGSNSAWVITDDQGNILGLPQAPPFDLEGEGPGVCLVWHLSFEDGLMGAEVGKNASDLSGCFDLSNPIEVTRKSGDDCMPEVCRVNAGRIYSKGRRVICAGDGNPDPIQIVQRGGFGSNSGWLITDLKGNILALPTMPPFDFEGAGPGICVIWHIKYEGILSGLEIGNNSRNLRGCYDLSNPAFVYRNGVNGGEISTEDPTTICAGDGTPDPIHVTVGGDLEGRTARWIITDQDGNILALPKAPPFDFEEAGPGVCLIWHAAVSGWIYNLSVGNNVEDLSGCFDLSNPIAVTRRSGNECGSNAQLPDVAGFGFIETSENQFQAEELELSPNPAKDLLNVLYSGDVSAGRLTISDINGQLVRTLSLANESQNIELNVSDLPAGAYVLSIVTNASISSKKFIVAR